ncbi:transcriptional regulator [Spirosoma lacussanchae]|uniref:FMN-binding negative transcriptional regulator n=1 Tax=Spirosoma lacussanchae TaxID=1884249 RepID=UPI0011082DA8|nr:FMN-binding negative transcriptional regulator [Spirosoma lacussanchae]
MYINKHNRETDPERLLAFMQAHSFALFITTGENGVPMATHLPIELVISADGPHKLVGHLAKANPQWKTLAQETPALVVFSGPHAYISSSWYDHPNVPTWNYLSVQASGRTRILSDDETLALLRIQLDRYEATSEHPVSVDSLTEAYVRREMRGVVAFEMTIDTLEGAAKLSQNRDDRNYAAIVAQLRQLSDPDARRIADEMAARRQPPDRL